MNDDKRFGIPSTAAISGYPLHPLLVTLPIGFLIGSFLSDLAFYSTADGFWARASAWLIGAGLRPDFWLQSPGLWIFSAAHGSGR